MIDAYEEALFRELERDDDHLTAQFREKRLAQLKYEQQKQVERIGTYDLFRSEKSLMETTTTSEKCIIHFSHKDFKRCLIMDKHLETIARRHPKTRFMKIDVEDCPFLVEKMDIKILPCIMSFVNGLAVDTYIQLTSLLGFEGITEKYDFPTSALEQRLAVSEALSIQKVPIASIYRFNNQQESSDEDE